MRLAIVIPALGEAAQLAATIASARGPAVAECIVVDGGSRDASVAVARAAGALVIDAPRGRARQMNAGAVRATADSTRAQQAPKPGAPAPGVAPAPKKDSTPPQP